MRRSSHHRLHHAEAVPDTLPSQDPETMSAIALIAEEVRKFFYLEIDALFAALDDEERALRTSSSDRLLLEGIEPKRA